MSLKAVHIVFIASSVLLAFGFAGWCFQRYFSEAGSAMDLLWGGLAVAAGVALIVYGRYMLRKLKHMSYL